MHTHTHTQPDSSLSAFSGYYWDRLKPGAGKPFWVSPMRGRYPNTLGHYALPPRRQEAGLEAEC